MLKKECVKRFVTDILYADLEEGGAGFLKLAYDRLKLQDHRRLMKMRERYHKISGNVVNAVFEDIIGIVVEEICQKGNKELHEDLMDYYLKRFPLIKEEFEKCGNDTDKWMDLYEGSFNGQDGHLANFLQRSLMLLCCVTYGEKSAVNKFLEMWQGSLDKHYEKIKYDFYGRQSNGGYMEWIEKIYVYKEILHKKGYKTYIENIRESLAVYFETDSDKIEKEIFNTVVCARPNLYGYNNDGISEDELDFIEMHDGLNDICRRHHVSQLELRDNSNQMYLDIIRRNIEKWCSKELFNSYFEAGETNLHYVMLEKEFGRYEMEKCVSELITMTWLEFYVMNQQKLWDEFYRRFSFDSPEEDIEKLLEENKSLKEENSSLKEENSRHRKKIQQYADADAGRKQQQDREAKKNDRKHTEQTALLEKQLEKQKKENERQCRMLEERDRYIGLLETADDTETGGNEPDYAKLYGCRIAFIGGTAETVSRLKSVFSSAAFINDETAAPPQKTDLIVILGGSGNHALTYRYIGLAEKQGINIIYSNSANAESVIRKVADSI